MQYKMGIVGLGVMGANLALNMERNGFPVAGYDLDVAKITVQGVPEVQVTPAAGAMRIAASVLPLQASLPFHARNRLPSEVAAAVRVMPRPAST